MSRVLRLRPITRCGVRRRGNRKGTNPGLSDRIGPHRANQTHRSRAQNAASPAQQHCSGQWSPVSGRSGRRFKSCHPDSWQKGSDLRKCEGQGRCHGHVGFLMIPMVAALLVSPVISEQLVQVDQVVLYCAGQDRLEQRVGVGAGGWRVGVKVGVPLAPPPPSTTRRLRNRPGNGWALPCRPSHALADRVRYTLLR